MNISVLFELSLNDLIYTINYMALELSVIYFVTRTKTVSRMLFQTSRWNEILCTGAIGGLIAVFTNVYFDTYLKWYIVGVAPQTSLLFGMLFGTPSGIVTGLFSIVFASFVGNIPSSYSILTVVLGLVGGLFRSKFGKPWYNLRKSTSAMFAAYALTMLFFQFSGRFSADLFDEVLFTLFFKTTINMWVLYIIAHLFIETQTLKNKDLLTGELELAAQLQHNIIPDFQKLDLPPQIAISGFLQPAKSIGGDWCDCLINNESIDIVIGDVSDKGIPAALFMAASCVAFRINMKSIYKTPAEAMQLANNSLRASNSCFMFVTACCGKINPATGEFSYCAVGHPPIALVRNNSVEFFKAPDKGVLGLLKRNKPYTTQNMSLHSGDILFFYTDGITEAANCHFELFGSKRLSSALSAVQKPNPDTLITSVRTAIADFVGEFPQSDDICMLAFQYIQEDQLNAV